jgi:hypothetical protein
VTRSSSRTSTRACDALRGRGGSRSPSRSRARVDGASDDVPTRGPLLPDGGGTPGTPHEPPSSPAVLMVLVVLRSRRIRLPVRSFFSGLCVPPPGGGRLRRPGARCAFVDDCRATHGVATPNHPRHVGARLASLRRPSPCRGEAYLARARAPAQASTSGSHVWTSPTTRGSIWWPSGDSR